MDVKELKKLIKNSTAVLVLDNGEPSMVILDYKLYKDLISEKEEKDIKINHGNGNGHGDINEPQRMQHIGSAIGNGVSGSGRESELLDKLNREILALKNQIEIEERAFSRTGLTNDSD